MSTLVSAAVVEDTRAEVALVNDDNQVSTVIFASFDGRNIVVKFADTRQTILSIETVFAR